MSILRTVVQFPQFQPKKNCTQLSFNSQHFLKYYCKLNDNCVNLLVTWNCGNLKKKVTKDLNRADSNLAILNRHWSICVLSRVLSKRISTKIGAPKTTVITATYQTFRKVTRTNYVSGKREFTPLPKHRDVGLSFHKLQTKFFKKTRRGGLCVNFVNSLWRWFLH